MKKRNNIIRVDEKEFEFEDGTVIPHFEDLEEVPTLEEFQDIFNYWDGVLNEYKREINKY